MTPLFYWFYETRLVSSSAVTNAGPFFFTAAAATHPSKTSSFLLQWQGCVTRVIYSKPYIRRFAGSPRPWGAAQDVHVTPGYGAINSYTLRLAFQGLLADITHPSQQVRVLGVKFSADFSLEKHVTKVSVLLLPSSSTSTCPAYTQWCYDSRSTSLWCLESTTATSFSLGLQRLSLTSCSECWTRQLVWLLVPGSSTAVWSSWYILSSTGLMHLSASSISSVCLCVAVWNCFMVYRGTLHSSLRDYLKTSSSFCCQSSVCCAVLPTEFLRTSGFHCRRPDNMELTAENDPIYSISVSGRLLETFFFSEY